MTHAVPSDTDMRPTLGAELRAAEAPLITTVVCPSCRQPRHVDQMMVVRDREDIPFEHVCAQCESKLDQAIASAQRVAERSAYRQTVGYAREKAIAELAGIRWEREAKGFSHGGVAILLDDRTQARISGALHGMALILEDDPEATPTVDWQAQPGVCVTLGQPELRAMGLAAYAHVQACFGRVKALTEAILAAETPEAVAAIDLTTGWPGA